MLILLAGLASTAFAESVTVIVETTPSADIRGVVSALGGTLLDSMDANTYLVSVPAIPKVYPVGVLSIEPDSLQLAVGPGGAVFTIGPNEKADFYRNQPAMQKINLA